MKLRKSLLFGLGLWLVAGAGSAAQTAPAEAVQLEAGETAAPAVEPETTEITAPAVEPETTEITAPAVEQESDPGHTAGDDQSTPANPRVVTYACALQDLQRRVEVAYLDPMAAVPCEVNYYKDVETPGMKQTLWTADSSEGYCEQQAENLVSKLRGWGWDCGTQ